MTAEAPALSPAAVYEAGLALGELRYQQCDGCDRAVFYPRVLCPHCGSGALTWRTSSGNGVVYAGTVVRSRNGSNSVALIDLEEGFRMMCRMQSESDTAVGTAVTAVIAVGSSLESLTFTSREELQ